MAFNESKIHSKQSIESKLADDSESDPLEMIRTVLMELPNNVEADKSETNEKIRVMLQVS